MAVFVSMVLTHHTHQWIEATCTEPRTCGKCGETEGEALGHQWLAATCTAPQTCSVCGMTEGTALGHQWDLNDLARGIHYCPACQHTEPVYINDLPYVGKVGKLWLMGGESPAVADTDIDDAAAYLPNRQDILGYSIEAWDSSGNLHQRGLFVDGSVSAEYEVTYYIGGRFSTFSGVYASAPLRDDTLLVKKDNGEQNIFKSF